MNIKLKNIIIFLSLNFVVSFMSDIVLNDLSMHFNIIQSLQPYFYKQSIIKSAVFAGITILVALLINMGFSYFLFRFIIPNNLINLIKFCILAFFIGYILDIFIYKMQIFGNRLNDYYKDLGAGFWGAIAFVFSIIISYFIQKNIYLVCYNDL
jgi:hypothetical protein